MEGRVTLALGNVDTTLLTTTTNPVLATNTGEQLFFIKVTADNTDSAQHFVTIYRTPGGGSPAASQELTTAYPVPANMTIPLPLGGQTFINGQQVFASADTANVVNLNIAFGTL
jgi:hypothetical protein